MKPEFTKPFDAANPAAILALVERMERAEAQNDELRIALADKVSAAAMMTSLSIENGGINTAFEGGACQLLADAFGQQFRDAGAVNFLEMRFHAGDSFDIRSAGIKRYNCIPGDGMVQDDQCGSWISLYTIDKMQLYTAPLAAAPMPAAPVGDLPPLPCHPEPHTYTWTARERETILEYGKACAARQPVQADAPHILEALSYHARERDDLTLEDAVEAFRFGWKRVPGRTERAFLAQIIHLLASRPAAPEPVQADALDARVAELEAQLKAMGARSGWYCGGDPNNCMCGGDAAGVRAGCPDYRSGAIFDAAMAGSKA